MRNSRTLAVTLFTLGFAVCFALGVAFHKYAGKALRNYLGVSGVDLVTSPGAALRVHARGWDAFRTTQPARDKGALDSRRYVGTGLLPLVMDGRRLSDSYPIPKNGGAITSVGSTVIILDRLGGLYRYDRTAGSFAPLQIPRLPNNLDAYLRRRPESRHDLAAANSKYEFVAYDIVFLSDRNELAASYDKFDETSGNLRTEVSVIKVDAATLSATGTWEQVFISDPYASRSAWATGGKMAYRGESKLYLTFGDHNLTDLGLARNSSPMFGKIFEIDVSARKWRRFTSGHRNPQGLVFTKSGQLLSTEHGPRGGDKLNLITEGSDYGWPNVTLGTEYYSYNWDFGSSSPGNHAGYTPPLFAWMPSVAVSQIIEVNNFHERWNGDLLVGSLKGLSLYRLRMEAGRVLYSEPIWIGQRIRDMAETTDGTIVLWTDDAQLIFISPDKDQLAINRLAPDVVSDAVADACMLCHHFGPTSPTDFAPTLSNLLNRPIASDVFRYSAGLRAKQGTWTKDLLLEFLSDPDKFANGTAMPYIALDGEQIKDIIDVIARASASGERRSTSELHQN